jgi:uncharacterized protein YjiS (DUF1127 family)
MQMTERARDDVGISFNDSLKRALKEPLGIDALKLMVERLDDPFLVGGTKIMIKRHPDRPVGLRATMHSLRRYRRSA